MDRTDQISALSAKLRDKTQEILKFVAKTYGLGDVASLEANKLQQLKSEVDEVIDQYEEALLEGDTPEEWRALDERLAQTAIGRLLQEHHEINEQILDLQDDEDFGEAGTRFASADRPALSGARQPNPHQRPF